MRRKHASKSVVEIVDDVWSEIEYLAPVLVLMKRDGGASVGMYFSLKAARVSAFAVSIRGIKFCREHA